MQKCQVRVSNSFCPCFDPNNWCTKTGLFNRGSNPRLITWVLCLKIRPLILIVKICFYVLTIRKTLTILSTFLFQVKDEKAKAANSIRKDKKPTVNYSLSNSKLFLPTFNASDVVWNRNWVNYCVTTIIGK